MNFQDIIQSLNTYWGEKGCVVTQPYDLQVGAGTFHHNTLLKSLGPEPWNVAYVQTLSSPDGREDMAKIPTACSITISIRSF